MIFAVWDFELSVSSCTALMRVFCRILNLSLSHSHSHSFTLSLSLSHSLSLTHSQLYVDCLVSVVPASSMHLYGECLASVKSVISQASLC